MNAFLILPAFNEERVIGELIDKIRKEIKKTRINWQIIVIDDGSKDNTARVGKTKRVVVLKHVINRGLGASLTTGLTYARMKKAEMAVSMDADGQHDPADIFPMVKPILGKKADIVIGKRSLVKMPFAKAVVNFFANFLTFLFFGIWTSDSQSGFRAFGEEAISNIQLKTQRMEVSSEIFSEIKRNNWKMVEVPIKVIYTEYSLKKGQKISNAVKILIRLVFRLFR